MDPLVGKYYPEEIPILNNPKFLCRNMAARNMEPSALFLLNNRFEKVMLSGDII
jgi:hypothetical protein